MSYKIAIASGKGGTGKTTVAVNLFNLLDQQVSSKIQLVDCDVEEPNDAIFFPNADKSWENEVLQMIPVIDKRNCTYCRACVEWCEFNAIVVIPGVKFAEVNDSLCHSCGSCLVACKDAALKETLEPIGMISSYDIARGNGLLEGKLKIGSAMQTMLIKELKKQVSPGNDIVIYDSPPGTSCPVVETICDTDYVVLVSEPTPFGVYDLELMTALVKEIQKPFGVIINKAGLGDDKIYSFLAKQNIEILGEIPFNQQYAAKYANGNLFNGIPGVINDCYIRIAREMEKRIVAS